MAFFVHSGQHQVTEVIPGEKYKMIARWLVENPQGTPAAAREALGDSISYNEVRMVQGTLENRGEP